MAQCALRSQYGNDNDAERRAMRELLVKTALVAHCPHCYRYQVVEKRHDNGKLRLSCNHRIKPRRLVDVSYS